MRCEAGLVMRKGEGLESLSKGLFGLRDASRRRRSRSMVRRSMMRRSKPFTLVGRDVDATAKLDSSALPDHAR